MPYTPPNKRAFTRAQLLRMRKTVFVPLAAAELQRYYHRQRVFDVGISTNDADTEPYDIVVTRGTIVRHVALLTRSEDRADDVWINEQLATLPSGCVVQLVVSDNLDIVQWRWFGGEPGEPLPEGSKRPKVKLNPPEHPDAPPQMHWRSAREQPPPGMRELRFVDFQSFEGSNCLDWVAFCLIGRLHAADDIGMALKGVLWRGREYENWSALQLAMMESKENCTVTGALDNNSERGSIKVSWGDSWVSYTLRLDEDGRWTVDDTSHFGVHRA